MSKTQKVKTSIVPIEVVHQFGKEGVAAMRVADTITIQSASEEQKAYDVLRDVATAIKTIEKKRTAITKPINVSLREVNAMFKTLASPFKEADKTIRDKIMVFRRAEEEKAEAERRAKQEAADREMERRRKIQESHKAKGHQITELAEVEVEEVEAEVAESTTTVKRWTWEVVDLKKVPDEFFVLDLVAVNKAVKDGEREIPGLMIYQEEKVRL